MLPAPVAPEQGMSLSTTATERSELNRSCRAMLNPMIPAPMITTSKEWEAGVGSIAEARAGTDRSALIVLEENEMILWGSSEPNKQDSAMRPGGNGLFGGEANVIGLGVGFGESIVIAAID